MIQQLAQGQTPKLLNFQAQIEGTPTGSFPITFSIFDDATAGTRLWTETQQQVVVQEGSVIRTLLGSDTLIPDSVFTSAGNRYLSINISGEELLPRFQITSVAYAYRSAMADELAGSVIDKLTNRIDSLTNAITELSFRESIRGMFQRPTETTGCRISNPFTGECSCDTGYTERRAGEMQDGAFIFYCTRDGAR